MYTKWTNFLTHRKKKKRHRRAISKHSRDFGWVFFSTRDEKKPTSTQRAYIQGGSPCVLVGSTCREKLRNAVFRSVYIYSIYLYIIYIHIYRILHIYFMSARVVLGRLENVFIYVLFLFSAFNRYTAPETI